MDNASLSAADTEYLYLNMITLSRHAVQCTESNKGDAVVAVTDSDVPFNPIAATSVERYHLQANTIAVQSPTKMSPSGSGL